MPDDANVQQKVHLNVHLPEVSKDPDQEAVASEKLGRRRSPRLQHRKGAKRPFLHCRDGYCSSDADGQNPWIHRAPRLL